MLKWPAVNFVLCHKLPQWLGVTRFAATSLSFPVYEMVITVLFLQLVSPTSLGCWDSVLRVFHVWIGKKDLKWTESWLFSMYKHFLLFVLKMVIWLKCWSCSIGQLFLRSCYCFRANLFPAYLLVSKQKVPAADGGYQWVTALAYFVQLQLWKCLFSLFPNWISVRKQPSPGNMRF